MNFKKSLLATVFAFTAIANAQEEKPTFSLSGEFRPRTEWIDGFNYRYQPAAAAPAGNTSGRVGTPGYVETTVRAAINATYTTASYTTYIGLQEVFTLGDRPQISAAGNGNFRIQEAWADLKINEALSVKIGRQPLSYDDQRILGGLGWAQQARTHDVGVLKYNKGGYSIDAGYSLNTMGDNIYDTALLFSYREMAFIHANKKFGATNISALILNNNFQNNTASKSNLTTAGVHFDTKLGPISLSGNGYIQDGLRAGDVEVDMAYLASLNANINLTKITSVGVGGEIISGKKSATSQGFFPLYGTNHAFNGLMDRFYVGNHAGGNGLIDISAKASTKIIKGISTTLIGHYFKEQSMTKNNLGSEVDLVVAKKFNGYSIAAGYSQFFESDDFPNPAANAPAKDTQNWAWIMLTIKPKFL
ncbi:hypothetical protein AXE80_01455 [Wenyingzhuangia fucanilytica]|uniref:Alginate export domain-containing protein n=1 Tax=Wenyingzhuangia fucanilytica TaxID=1790137 RepID=A0A1B1Y2R3_9FLAO|nr:hypothetical protein [Wenyingzhuangia fucanilytica]ANW95040.1 hypothetical protein AXE80_01455 [Wenyingzhuangia fucanilytica]